MELELRIRRDQENNSRVRAAAKEALSCGADRDGRSGIPSEVEESFRRRLVYRNGRSDSLKAVASTGFQAMTEVDAEVAEGKRGSKSVPSLWYANVNSTSNEVFGNVNVVSWTHPGFQIALTTPLGEEEDVPHLGYTLLSVTPRARAKFSSLEPTFSGLYEPGGVVGAPGAEESAPRRLKAVKLDMTRPQVEAFISRMSGLMIVTGAPGSGKTTVALQRVRFLYDQQELGEGSNLVEYAPELTRVFLANTNLIGYTRELLTNDLKIPARVVELVPSFVREVLNDFWREKGAARPRTRKVQEIEEKARRAVLGLARVSDLRGCWRLYEEQIYAGMRDAEETAWFNQVPDRLEDARKAADELASSLINAAETSRFGGEPLVSKFRMDTVFREVRKPYESLRMGLRGKARDRFDLSFARWLYEIYDPLQALASYFGSEIAEAKARMRRGTAARADENRVMEAMQEDWRSRLYGQEEMPWLAWLLRFALPEEVDPRARFRGVASALPMVGADGEGRWTHVVIDEAQDLSVAEASLLASLVHPDGALTVAADFRQVVSPVHGTTEPDGVRFACTLSDKSGVTLFPFATNMRQSSEMGTFLRNYYERAFGEAATFGVSERFRDALPQLIVCPRAEFARRIRQWMTALDKSKTVSTRALIQINEDAEEMRRLREALRDQGVSLEEAWKALGRSGGRLITSSAERVKGLEYDGCVVLGLETVTRSSLNFALNRAYVALSRPSRRLIMISEEYPEILRNVDKTLFETWQG